MRKTATVNITDPATLQLLANYKSFLQQEDGIDGTLTLTQMVEGLVVGCLDEHSRFRQWNRMRNGALPAQPNESASNVTRLPLPNVRQLPEAAPASAAVRQRVG